jgi:uncharacterized glyoxalase superfamily protein PhnB
MSDPYEVLRSPIDPVMPDRAFADRLRARIERALALPKGVTVSNLGLDDIDLDRELDPDLGFDATGSTLVAEAGEPASGYARAIGRAQITPYLAVAGAAEAIAWYSEAFGARTMSPPIVMDDGRVGHAELEIGGARLMLADEFPEIGHAAPNAVHGSGVTLHLSVADVDAVVERAVAAGARLDRAPDDFEYGRNGAIRDPFGHRWIVSQEPVPTSRRDAEDDQVPERTFREGDIGYVSLQVPSVNRAARFFSSVLGWRYEPASGPQGRRVHGLELHHGIWGGQQRSTLFLCFAVENVEEAVQRVVAAGGIAGLPHVEPYGTISDCTDDQGVEFAMFQPPGGVYNAAGPERAGSSDLAEGEIAYVTIEVPDSAKTRAFYGSVLGWHFIPGNVADGWQVEGVHPMVGISGGHRLATTLPMYQVRDVASAVAKVREGGGSAGELETHPYGITANCEDDQETRFYLGQL